MSTSPLVAIVYEGFEQNTNPDTEECTRCNIPMQNKESWYLFDCFYMDAPAFSLEFLCVPCAQQLLENIDDSVRNHSHTNLEGVK